MRKGLFWVINELDNWHLIIFAAECDHNGALLDGQSFYNSRKGNSYAHKNSWESAAGDCSREVRNKPWNYYPRGRVEIANVKAIIYHNPNIAKWLEFESTVLREFGLESFPVRFMPDYSKHYQSLVEG